MLRRRNAQIGVEARRRRTIISADDSGDDPEQRATVAGRKAAY